MSKQTDILVIGGGVIGVSVAYYLAKQGRSVTLVDRDDICSGSSYGNVGLIANGHAIPLAAPGMLTQGLKWLLDPGSPFYIKPRFNLDLWRWLWQFRAAATEKRVHQGIPVLLWLSQSSLALFEELVANENLDFGFVRKGFLHLFNNQHSFKKDVEEATLLKEYGVDSTILDSDGVRQIEPNVLPSVTSGIYYPDYAQIIPDRFVHELARVIKNQGVNIKTNTEVLGFEVSGKRISAITTTRGSFQPDQVVLAAGAWSAKLARDLGIKISLQPAKGYSITFKSPPNSPQLPLSLIEHKAVVSPMGDMLRISSTLELAGFDSSINQRRVTATREAIGKYLPNAADLELIEIWRGFRPASPDGLPIIGRSDKAENLILATGHGMLGMTHGPITGKLVSQIITGETPALDLTPLRVERF